MREAIDAYFSVYTEVFLWIADHITLIIATLGIPLMIIGIFLAVYSIPLMFIGAAAIEGVKWLIETIFGRRHE